MPVNSVGTPSADPRSCSQICSQADGRRCTDPNGETEQWGSTVTGEHRRTAMDDRGPIPRCRDRDPGGPPTEILSAAPWLPQNPISGPSLSIERDRSRTWRRTGKTALSFSRPAASFERMTSARLATCTSRPSAMRSCVAFRRRSS